MYQISSKGIWDSVMCTGNMRGSVADPDPVGSGPFWSDPDLFGRIRILTLINDPISTILVCVKVINTLGLPVDTF
jgi:hypothetical protein